MKTFLINYDLLTYQYMEDGKTRERKTIMVEAEDESKANATLAQYWEDQSDRYSTSYGVDGVEVIPTINQLDILK